MQHSVTPAQVDPMSVLVVLPTYNERATLARVVADVLRVSDGVQVLIVDDASPDGTGAIADTIAAADARVTVLHRPAKLGLGTAYVAGFTTAIARGFDFAVEMDSDGSHRADELPALLAAAQRGAGLVIGTRWMPGGRIVNWPRHRRLISRGGTAFARRALRSELRDLTSGFRVLSCEWLERLDLAAIDSEGYAFQVELAWRLERLSCPVEEVPITFVERSAGRSKMSAGIVFEALTNVMRWGREVRRFGPGKARTSGARADSAHAAEAPVCDGDGAVACPTSRGAGHSSVQ